MKNNYNIAFVPSTFLPTIGGAEIQTHNLANTISKKGFNVDIWNTKKGFYKKKLYNVKNFNKIIVNLTYILRYYFNIQFNFFLRKYLKKLIDKNGYIIWHFHSTNFKTLIIIEALKELKQKVVVTFHGIDIQIDKKIRYGYRLDSKYEKILKKNLKNVDRIHSISEEIDKDLKKLNFPKKKILRVPDCINLKKFKKFKIKKPKTLTLLTVARYSEKKKGYDFVEKISRELIKKIKFKWIIIGKNVSKLSNDKFISKNKSKFKFVEEIYNNEYFFPNSKLIKFYKSSSIYIHLSRIESFGITILEALSSGLPIISFHSTGSKTLIKKNLNGYFIKCYNTKNYAKKIIDLQQNKNKLIKPDYKYLSNYDLNKNAVKSINDYKSLTNL